MVDWSKYPVWAKTQGRLSAVELLELGAWLSDVRRAERERCARHLRERYFAYATADAIEAMGDDDA